jgi:radical SAM superfamily enzyme YgiQ (UPF0313 family)
MRILLIQTHTIIDEPPIYPLGISYLAAALKNHEVKLFDINTEEDALKKIGHLLDDFCPYVVGISIRNMKIAQPGIHYSCFQHYVELIKFIKSKAKSAVLIGGGAAFSLYAEKIMELVPEFDMGVFGEGEETFPQLLNNMASPEKVKGIYFRQNGKVVFTGYPVQLDFDKINPPSRDLLDITKYQNEPTAIGVQTKRGCALQCLHCSDTYLTGNKIRLRSSQKVVDEIEELVNTYGIKQFMFADQVFNIPKHHAIEICEEIISRKLKVKWSAWFNEKFADAESLSLAKKAGCELVSFSPDSASDKVLQKLNKNIRTRDIITACKSVKKAGIPVTFNFMLNGPGENMGSLFKLCVFLLRAKLILGNLLKLHGLFIVNMRIYPHTELSKLAIKQEIIREDDDLIEPVFYNPPPLNRLVSIGINFLTALWKIKKKLIKKPVEKQIK